MISIIIPAHNEEQVILATLNQLEPGVNCGELEVIVVCNGCTDNTAEIVASFNSKITCIESSIPSKVKALNLGDNVAKGFPRFYQDADVVLSLNTIRQIAKLLESGRFLAATPRMCMNYKNASWLVRSYYDVWQQLPYVQEGMIGVGVYALSSEGRKRFDVFPDIISDDGYIRALFTSVERTTVDTCCSLVRAPVNLEGLLKIKTRSRLGGYELKSKFPNLVHNEKKNYARAIAMVLCRLWLWPKIPVYLAINMLTRLRAKKHFRNRGFTGWERDNTSRLS